MKRLSVKAHRLICKRLLRRYRRDRGIVAIGIGQGMKGGKADIQRPQVVHFFVRSKRKFFRRHKDSIPAHVRVRTGKGRTKMSWEFPTDVIAIGSPRLTKSVRVDGATEWFTGGYVVRWMQAGSANWAILSVGHGTTQGASVVIAGLTGIRPVILCTNPGNTVDACLIQLGDGDLAALGAGGLDATTPPIPYLKDTDFSSLPKPHNAFLDLQGSNPDIAVISMISGSPLVPDLPNLQDFIYATSKSGTFKGGTSGSPWLSDGPPAFAIQTAGYPSDENGTVDPSFFQGFGQLIDPMLRWASKGLGVSVSLITWL